MRALTVATGSFEDSQLCFGNVHHSSLSSSRSQVKHCQNKPNQYQEPKSEGEHRLFRILAWIERRINKYPGPAQLVYHSLNDLGHNLFSTSGMHQPPPRRVRHSLSCRPLLHPLQRRMYRGLCRYSWRPRLT